MAAEIKFLMDEHVPAAVTRGLQARGVDALTAQDAHLAHTADDRILAYALEQGRVVFTQDEDFLAEHQRGTPHAGMVYAHQQTSIGVIVRGLLLIHGVFTPDDMRGHLEYL
jgi:uncharacterized protein with PIN domain